MRWTAIICLVVATSCAKASEHPDASHAPVDGPGPGIDAAGPGIDAAACSPNGSTQQCYTADPSTIGVGLCVRGMQTCVDGQWDPACVGEITPRAEQCNTADDDCDGTPDDGDPGGGGACTTGLAGVCSAGTAHCMLGSVACVQNVMPSADVCNGADDDCNAASPDGSAEAWFGQPCDGADVDACNEGTLVCNGVAQACSDATGDSNVIGDGGFENGPTGGVWTEFSTNFGTPTCDVTSCGTGGGTGPHGGTFWSWLGGTTATEVAYVNQSRVIPVGTATLTFFLEIPVCTVGGAAETFTVTIDGTPVFSATNSDPACNVIGYVQKSINVSAFANGASHTIEFRGVFNTGQTGVTNFMVDDIRLVSCP